MMLSDCAVIAFVPTSHPERARSFYGDVLGLHAAGDTPFALVFDAHGATLRIHEVPTLTPAPYTVLGWQVPDIRAAIEHLAKAGIAFERYAGMAQDDLGVWVTPDGYKVCWFKDPGGNTLSLTQSP